jgi:hypothetical protein
MADDRIQHGIDDDPNNDPAKGAALGGVGGAAVGAAAGSMLGPAGAVIGGIAGAVAGAAGSAAGVAAVDQVDNDNTMTGLGDSTDYDTGDDVMDADYAVAGAGAGSMEGATGVSTHPTGTYGRAGDLTPGNDVPGVQTGGTAADGTPDTRGIMEKTADAMTGDRLDDKTGKPVR